MWKTNYLKVNYFTNLFYFNFICQIANVFCSIMFIFEKNILNCSSYCLSYFNFKLLHLSFQLFKNWNKQKLGWAQFYQLLKMFPTNNLDSISALNINNDPMF